MALTSTSVALFVFNPPPSFFVFFICQFSAILAAAVPRSTTYAFVSVGLSAASSRAGSRNASVLRTLCTADLMGNRSSDDFGGLGKTNGAAPRHHTSPL